MSNFALSQMLIGIAFISDCASFQFKGRRLILLFLIASTVLIATHFFLLENHSAGALVLVSTARFTVAYFSKSKRWMLFFIVVACATLYFTYKTPLNILPMLASVIASIASFQSRDRPMRIGMMLGTSLWIVHNILAQTPAATLLEVFFLISNFIGYWRFYSKRKRSNVETSASASSALR